MAFQITLADADTGHFLDADGSWADEPDTHFRDEFESEAEAREAGQQLLEEHPFAECRIENLESGEVDHLHHPKREQYVREKQEWEAWKRLPTVMRVFVRKPECFVFQPRES